MTVTIKTRQQVETETKIEIEFPSYFKRQGSIFAIFSEDHAVEVMAFPKAKYITVKCAAEILSDNKGYGLCTADEFNNALFQVTSNLIPIPDKEVYELEQAEDELNINMELLEAMRSDVVNEVPIEIYEPSANATL